MRIYSMTATFGKLEHETLTLQPGLNIIQAPNEWGKSTWCAFLAAMLYGIETRVHTTKAVIADKERYAPWSGSPMSGRIDLNWNGRDITIERRTKGRSIFGDFKAYETDTGLPVPELTCANCGQLLLGVEKSVFTRAGFLRLSDLPVTQDESLRRRLNALVTTGDESGTADALAQKLKDLKNRCRLNRSTGLLPQLEAQRGTLEGKLRELQEQQLQSAKLKERLTQLETHHAQLLNHQAALDYAANRTYSEKLATAEEAHTAAAKNVQALEASCSGDPEADVLEQQLAQLRYLRECRESVHMDIQLLPEPPQAPDIPNCFRDLPEEDAARQAQTDMNVFFACERDARTHTVSIIGLIMAALGIGLLFIPSWIFRGLGIAALLGGLLCLRINHVTRRRANRTAANLAEKYAPLLPEEWVAAAKACVRSQERYNLLQHEYTEKQAELQNRITTVNTQIAALTQGFPLAWCEQEWTAALERQKALFDARRELHRCTDLVQTLRASHKDAAPPAMADTLTYSETDTARLLSDCTFEQRQLQLQLGNCQGRMESLGQETALRQQLEAVNLRICKLEDTYAALDLAQSTLSKASAELQRRFAPRIAKRAQALFKKLTHDRYDRLTLDEDLSVQAGAQNEDTLHSVLWRSEGTVDQLYLALRLAVAEELTPDAPLILDDALVRFDDQRLTQAMQILEEAAVSKQVILFTCQSREAAIHMD